MTRLRTVVWCAVLLAVSSCSPGPEVHEGVVPVQEGALAYRSVGTGEAVVILHGGPGLDHGYVYDGFLPLASNYRVVFYDQRGSGGSESTLDSSVMTVQQFVEDLEALRRHLDLGSIHLVGHSWGGMLAMSYALEYPESVQSMTLVSSIGATSDFLGPFIETRTRRTLPADSAAMADIAGSRAFSEGDSAAVSAYLSLIFKTYVHDKRSLEHLDFRVQSRTAKNVMRIINRIFSSFPYDLRDGISTLRIPTLIIHGDYDPIPDRFAEEIHQLIPHSEYALLKECGHFPFAEKPEEFLATIRTFLAGQER